MLAAPNPVIKIMMQQLCIRLLNYIKRLNNWVKEEPNAQWDNRQPKFALEEEQRLQTVQVCIHCGAHKDCKAKRPTVCVSPGGLLGTDHVSNVLAIGPHILWYPKELKHQFAVNSILHHLGEVINETQIFRSQETKPGQFRNKILALVQKAPKMCTRSKWFALSSNQ